MFGKYDINPKKTTVRPSGCGSSAREVDIGGVGNHGGSGTRNLFEQALLVGYAAEIDAIGVAIGREFFPPQLAPVGLDVQPAADASDAGVLPGEIVVDVVGVNDQDRCRFAGWHLAQIAVAKEREFQVDDVKLLGVALKAGLSMPASPAITSTTIFREAHSRTEAVLYAGRGAGLTEIARCHAGP